MATGRVRLASDTVTEEREVAVNRTLQFALAAALLLAVPSLVRAQRAVRVSSSTSARARSGVVHAGSAHATAGRKAPRARAADSSASFGDPLTIQQLLDPFPGFGFDFEFLNSVDRDLAIKALIDPITEQRLALAERLQRRSSGIGSSGFFLLDGGGAYAIPPGSDATDQTQSAEQKPQVIVVQMPASQQKGEESAGLEAPESASLPDVGEFTLVLRNGSRIQAVAFTRRDDKIIYITPSGGRRILAVSDLDTDSTERTNQENGTPLQLSL